MKENILFLSVSLLNNDSQLCGKNSIDVHTHMPKLISCMFAAKHVISQAQSSALTKIKYALMLSYQHPVFWLIAHFYYPKSFVTKIH